MCGRPFDEAAYDLRRFFLRYKRYKLWPATMLIRLVGIFNNIGLFIEGEREEMLMAWCMVYVTFSTLDHSILLKKFQSSSLTLYFVKGLPLAVICS